MPNEILIYEPMGAYSSQRFITEINSIDENDSLVLRLNTPGGSVDYGNGMIAKFTEFKGEKIVKVDGQASSMGLFFLVYADQVEALNVSKFVLHRAAYPSWYEADYMTEAEKADLVAQNDQLRKDLSAKIDVKMFESLKGVKMKDVFSMEDRIDVSLTAKEAKAIGLISKVNKLTPAKSAKIKAEMADIAAVYAEENIQVFIPEIEADEQSKKEIPNKLNKNKVMTLEELKAQHPGIYAKAVAVGHEAGVAAEKDRTGAWMAFASADLKAVTDGIASGENISQTASTELTIKIAKASVKKDAEAEATKDLETPVVKTPEDEAAANLDSFMSDLNKDKEGTK